jgi:hypothetical protein
MRIDPVIVTSTSETCTPEIRAAIADGFGAPLVDSYGSTEGLVGSSRPDEEAIVFAEDGSIVELVGDDNRPVPPGTPSAKILVTNLYNRVQPLIRYEITDRFVAEPSTATGPGHLRGRRSWTSRDSADDWLRPSPVPARHGRPSTCGRHPACPGIPRRGSWRGSCPCSDQAALLR